MTFDKAAGDELLVPNLGGATHAAPAPAPTDDDGLLLPHPGAPAPGRAAPPTGGDDGLIAPSDAKGLAAAQAEPFKGLYDDDDGLMAPGR